MDRVGYTGIYGRVLRMNYGLVFLNLINLIFDPLKSYGAYYCDLITDVLQAYTLFDNCHYKYAVTSISLLGMSYVVTVLHLIFLLKEPPFKAMMYPINHT